MKTLLPIGFMLLVPVSVWVLSQRPETTWYVSAPWMSEVIEIEAASPRDALQKSGITTWTRAELESARTHGCEVEPDETECHRVSTVVRYDNGTVGRVEGLSYLEERRIGLDAVRQEVEYIKTHPQSDQWKQFTDWLETQ